MVRNAASLLGDHLGGAHIKTFVNLHRIGADDLTAELLGQCNTQRGLAGSVGPTTASTGCFLLHDPSKLLFQLLPGQFKNTRPTMGQKGGTSPERIFSANAISS